MELLGDRASACSAVADTDKLPSKLVIQSVLSAAAFAVHLSLGLFSPML